MALLSGAVDAAHDSLAQFARVVKLWWAEVRDFFHGARVAWVALASAILGVLLFTFAPQAQDLFLDVRGSLTVGIPFWGAFYLGVLLVWVLPVYVSARWILTAVTKDAADRPDVRPVDPWVARLLPPVLAVLCLVAILFGQLLALSNSPTLIDEFGEKQATELEEKILALCPGASAGNKFTCAFNDFENFTLSARSILLDATKAIGEEYIIFIMYVVTLFIPVLFFLTWFWFYVSAKWPPFGRFLVYLIPAWFLYPWVRPLAELIGIQHTPFNFLLVVLDTVVAVLWPILWSLIPAGLDRVPWKWPRIIAKLLWWVLTLLIACVILVTSVGMVHGFVGNQWNAPLSIAHLALLPPVTVLIGALVWWSLKPRTDNLFMFLRSQFRLPVASGRAVMAEILCGRLFYAALAVSVFVIAALLFFHPVDISRHVYRVLMIPILLGLLVPPLTFISRLSFRWHAPIVVIAIIILSFSNTKLSEVNTIRTTEKSSVRPTLDESVVRWAAANDCALATPEGQGDCPSPVIVAAAGGASRAAFLTATVIGKFIDDHGTAQGSLPAFGKQLFALSGVSGGSLGAAVTYAALADSQRAERAPNGLGAPPCRADAHHLDTEWFAPHLPHVREPRPDRSWRDCLQLILAGDFLSPVFATLISNDILGFSHRGDRAIILEQAWERRYAHLTGQPEGSPDGLSTMESSLVNLRNRVLIADPAGKSWLPILLLNGTSVTSGRRIVTSDVDTLLANKGERSRGRLFRDSYDVHELMGLPQRNFESALFSPDGLKLLTVLGGEAQLWDIETDSLSETNPVKTLSLENSPVKSAKFSPDGRLVLTIHDDQTIQLWSVADAFRLEKPAFRGEIGSAEFSPDSQRIVTTHGSATATLWDIGSGAELRTLTPPSEDNSVQGAVFSPDGRHVLTHEQKGFRLWDTESGDAPRVVEGTRFAIFTSDSRRLITGVTDVGIVAIWDVETGEKLSTLSEYPREYEGDHAVESGALSHDDRIFMTSTVSQTVVWRTENLAPWKFIKAESGGVKSAQLSPNSTRLLIVSGGLARLWDIGTGLPLTNFKGQEGLVQGATFSPDGQRLLTWSDNGALNIWDVETGAELRVINTSRGSMSSCPHCDVRLSTAASMSARFPVISPHGNIRDTTGRITDRVVDGGYFENFGAITALELAKELKERFKLDPTVIMVNNEPATSGMQCVTQDSQLDFPKAPQDMWFPTFRAPIGTVIGTRSARGSHATVDLCSYVGAGHFAFVTVAPDSRNAAKELSMSWWLSKHVQKKLDDQMQTEGLVGNKAPPNKEAFKTIERWLTRTTSQYVP